MGRPRTFERGIGGGNRLPLRQRECPSGSRSRWRHFRSVLCDSKGLWRHLLPSQRFACEARNYLRCLNVLLQKPRCPFASSPPHRGTSSARKSKCVRRSPDGPQQACSHPDALSDSRRPILADNVRPRLPPRSSKLFRPARQDSGRRKTQSNTSPSRSD
jgi:hypothetical protein